MEERETAADLKSELLELARSKCGKEQVKAIRSECEQMEQERRRKESRRKELERDKNLNDVFQEQERLERKREDLRAEQRKIAQRLTDSATELKRETGRRIDVEILADTLEIADGQERWRNAIEGYLHTQKFYLLVPEKYYDAAARIVQRIRSHYAQDSFYRFRKPYRIHAKNRIHLMTVMPYRADTAKVGKYILPLLLLAEAYGGARLRIPLRGKTAQIGFAQVVFQLHPLLR